MVAVRPQLARCATTHGRTDCRYWDGGTEENGEKEVKGVDAGRINARRSFSAESTLYYWG